jgi:uncharacterized protein (DUF736 family)
MSDLINLGALWLNESKNGEKYMSGYLGEARLVIFKNKHKEEDKHPDYKVFIAKGKKQEEYEKGSGDGSGGGNQGGSRGPSSEEPF